LAILSRLYSEEADWLHMLANNQRCKIKNNLNITKSIDLKSSMTLDYSPRAIKKTSNNQLFRTISSVYIKFRSQIDRLRAFLFNVEDIVAKAERYCYILNKKVHEETFKMFIHLESPFTLIKLIAGKKMKK